MDSNHRPHAYQACALTTWAMRPFGGDEEDRTPDPLLAKQVLSQLSYTPMFGFPSVFQASFCRHSFSLSILKIEQCFLSTCSPLLTEAFELSFVLLRKEVIQPHLPIRLPCYDFTPVANPTFGSVLTRLDYWLRVLPAPMVWRAVCTRPGNVFTAACWSAITSNSDFMQASCSLQSELRRCFWVLLHLAVLLLFV